MRTKYAIINMLVGVGGQILNLILSFVTRIVFVHYLSEAYLGVNGLFTDVLGLLNLAELGIGTAMIFSLYEPAARNDHKQLTRLMNLYRRLYRIVALCVLLFGAVLLPFLHVFIKGGEGIEHLRLIYCLYVLNSAGSYLLSYKNSIYLAYQKGYIRTGLYQIFELVRFGVQILILMLTGNFILYLIAQFVIQFIPNILVSRRVDREFPFLKESKELPPPEERKHILKNVGALSLHRLATVVVRNTDSIIMSSFIGLGTVGLYSNYRMILSGLNQLISKFFASFTSGVGNLNAMADHHKVYAVYRELDFIVFLIYGYLAAGLAALLNPFVRILFGEGYCFAMPTVMIFVTEFYLSGMRCMNLTFREVKGLFWHDRYKAVVEAILNIVFSLWLVRDYGVAGILGGTVLSSLCTCVWVEPYVLMRYGMVEQWQKRLRDYFLTYALRLVLTAGIAALAVWLANRMAIADIATFILFGILYTLCFALLMLLLFWRSAEMRSLRARVKHMVKKGK